MKKMNSRWNNVQIEMYHKAIFTARSFLAFAKWFIDLLHNAFIVNEKTSAFSIKCIYVFLNWHSWKYCTRNPPPLFLFTLLTRYFVKLIRHWFSHLCVTFFSSFLKQIFAFCPSKDLPGSVLKDSHTCVTWSFCLNDSIPWRFYRLGRNYTRYWKTWLINLTMFCTLLFSMDDVNK